LEFLYRKNEPQRAQSFKIYLCETLRKTLRSLRLNKKMNFNCITHTVIEGGDGQNIFIKKITEIKSICFTR